MVASCGSCDLTSSRPPGIDIQSTPNPILLLTITDMPTPPIPPTFARKKSKILQDLSDPIGQYSDKSPKGSVDERIRGLIDEINAYEGFVTTSSCAGRISVFLEGHGKEREVGDGEEEVGRVRLPGGKGGGEFLFVSHEPVDLSGEDDRQLESIFGQSLEPDVGEGGGDSHVWDPQQRFVRFAFEPMVR
jgi:tRNA wybutosine-synthesizing protein 3